MRKVEQLDAVELIETDHAVIHQQHTALSLAKPLQFQDVHLQEAEGLVGNDQKVATAASRIKELHAAHTLQQGITLFHDGTVLFVIILSLNTLKLLELPHLVIACFQLVIGIPQLIEKQRIDHLHDIGHTGVVHPLVGSLLRIYHRLNHRAKDVRIDVLPIQLATFNDELPRPCSHARDLDLLGEETAIDIGELGDDLRYVTVALRTIHHVKRLIQVI